MQSPSDPGDSYRCGWVEADSSFSSVNGSSSSTYVNAYVNVCERDSGGTIWTMGNDRFVQLYGGQSWWEQIPISLTGLAMGPGSYDVGLCQHNASSNAQFWKEDTNILVFKRGSQPRHTADHDHR